MNDNTSKKYPRTYHFDWSHGTSDDKTITDCDHFIQQDIVVTEKMDGENTTMTREHIHARSATNTMYHAHPSRSRALALWHTIRNDIPVGWRVIGENVQQEYLHSIAYERLSEPYFIVFAIVDEWQRFLSWDDTVTYAQLLGLETVPVLYRGLWSTLAVHNCFTGRSFYGGAQEGYVVRLSSSFKEENFARSVAKFVRPNHVAGNAKYWRRNYVVKPLNKGTNDDDN